MSSDEYLLKPWKDSPLIAEALRDGRQPRDISVVTCDQCASVAYYNDGSHCACEHCGANLDHLLDEDSGEVSTLDDLMEMEALGDEMPF